MEYKIKRINENGTATVEMNIQGRILNQDFPLGSSTKDLENSVKEGLAVFKAEHDAREAESQDIGKYNDLIDKPISVTIKGEK